MNAIEQWMHNSFVVFVGIVLGWCLCYAMRYRHFLNVQKDIVALRKKWWSFTKLMGDNLVWSLRFDGKIPKDVNEVECAFDQLQETTRPYFRKPLKAWGKEPDGPTGLSRFRKKAGI